MQTADYKEKIIEMVEKIGNYMKKNSRDISKGAQSERKSKSNKLGSSNIRSVANICTNADCYEELRLYIEYKIGKGNGWNEALSDNKTFGRLVIGDMDQIYNDVNKDDKEALKWIALYFGYLYWKKAAIEKGKN